MTKFDGQRDFLVWKVQIQAYLRANDWFDVVDGTMDQGDTRFSKIDAKAMAVILNAVETPVVRAIMTLRTSKEMWNRLLVLYDSKSSITLGMLSQEFNTIQNA